MTLSILVQIQKNEIMADSSTHSNKKSERIVEEIFDDLVPGNECNIDCYTKHAKHYDEGIAGIKFDIPWRGAEMSMKYVDTDSAEKQVLDICVGKNMNHIKCIAVNGVIMRENVSGIKSHSPVRI